MIKNLKYIPYLIVVSVLFTGASCVNFRLSTGGTKSVGGIYKSTDAGAHWTASNLIQTTQAKVVSLAGQNINQLVMDPLDSRILYALLDKGAAITLDGATSWQYIGALNNLPIKALAINPLETCTLYVAYENRILRSQSCARTFNAVYTDLRPAVIITALAHHPSSTQILLAGLSSGEVIESLDQGVSWKTIGRFSSLIRAIRVHPKDPQSIFVATERNGLYYSNDNGNMWNDKQSAFDSFKKSQEFHGLISDPQDPKHIIHISGFGILETRDGGDTWIPIQMIAAPGQANIRALAIHPQQSNEFYFVTPTTIEHTKNNGTTWETKKLPEGYQPSALLIDFYNAANMFIATIKNSN